MGIMNLSEIMDKSIDVLKKYIKTIFLFTLGYGAICGIGSVVLIVVAAILGTVAYEFLYKSFVLPSIILGLLGSFLFAFLLTYNVGVIKIASQDFLGDQVYADEAIGASFKNIFKVFSIVLIVTIFFIPVIVVFGIGLYLISKGLKYSIDSITIAYGISSMRYVGLIIALLIIIIAVGIFWLYATFISFSLNAVVIEKKYGFSALKCSYRLIKNEFWKIIGCSILFTVTILAVRVSLTGFIEAFLSIIYLIANFFNMQINYTDFIISASRYIEVPMNILMWLIIYPLSTIMMCNMYFNQRYKKEGYDMILRLKKIQKNHERKKQVDGI
ncbi:hypothetical protein [Clostridium sp. JS66]|uniref:hypothetical protein n=1 Tax=Clostridium sp. JS66 TaxID=3064705 RepID=UPI00298DB9F7|nr:hypothetical protein [Clostridium sp. JS66]WPC44565.1 hypothetical protein Q6H37_14090 [Clostridium sp. JS66]